MPLWWPTPRPGVPVESGTVERIFWHRVDPVAGLMAVAIPRPHATDKLRIRSITINTSNLEYWNYTYAYLQFPPGAVHDLNLIPFTICHLQRGFCWRPPIAQDWDKEAKNMRIQYDLNRGVSTTTRITVEWERY